MDVQEFAAVYRSGAIRSWLNWDRLLAMRAEVAVVGDRSVETLRRLQTAWYLTPDRRLGDWRERADHRMTVEEAEAATDVLPPRSRDYVARLTDRLAALEGPPTLALPCAALPDGGRMVLDGNHQAVAALRTGREPRLLLVEVRVGADPLVLPDLLHDAGLGEAEWRAARAAIEREAPSWR